MEQNHELPSSFQETERCFYVCRKRMWAYSVSGIDIPLTHFFVRTSYFISVMRNSRLCNDTEENTMTLDAPEPIAAYLAAEEAKDADALSRCFTEDGTVHDEGRDYRGRDAIRQWKQAAGREIPIRSADGQRANAWKRGDRACPTHRQVPWESVELDHIFKLSNTRLLRWRFDHDDDIPFPRFGR